MFDPTILFQLGFYILLGIVTVHFIVMAYHWLTYGANRSHSIASIAIYLLGISVLLLTLSISLTQI